ncbi:MAG: hypothetical protein ACUVR6_09940 [Anaerolineae bacterium]
MDVAVGVFVGGHHWVGVASSVGVGRAGVDVGVGVSVTTVGTGVGRAGVEYR